MSIYAAGVLEGGIMSDSNNKAGAVVASLLIGMAVGAALGILFAPTSGKETRKKLNDWYDDALAKSKDAVEKVGDEFKHRKEQLAQAFHAKS